MFVGYARVSTQDQNLDLQKDALVASGCERIFTDVASGAKADRSGLNELLSFLRPGDTLVVWKFDRLGRSLRHLLDVVNTIHDKGAGLRSLQENIDTSSSGGKLIFHVFGALAEFERDLIRERTQAGLSAARARGRKGGRRKVMDEKKAAMAMSLSKDPTHSIGDICKTLGVSRATLYRCLNSQRNTQNGGQPPKA